MPKYFFHLNQLDEHVVDPEGAEFPGPAEARADALTTIHEIAGERMKAGEVLELLSIRITSENGDLVDEVFVDEALKQVVPPEAIGRLLQAKSV